MRTRMEILGLCLALATIGESANAQTLSEVEIYHRCYARMVREITPANDGLLADVKAGRKKGADACLALFDLAQLKPDGILANRSNDKAKKVLKTFHDLHRNWFTVKTPSNYNNMSNMIHDIEEPALYFTRAAFLPNEPFSSIVTHNQGLRGIRDPNPSAVEPTAFQRQPLINYNGSTTLEKPVPPATPRPLPNPAPIVTQVPGKNGEPDQESFAFPYRADTNLRIAYTKTVFENGRAVNKGVDLVSRSPASAVQFGTLVGIGTAIDFRFPSFRPNGLFGASDITDIKMNDHFGSGIIGSQTFINANANIGGAVADGVKTINRRLTAKVFEDIMCHQLPTLGDADVAGEIIPGSEHTFQTQSTCMRCHSSIDGLGFAFRNVLMSTSTGNPDPLQQTVGHNIITMVRIPTATGSTTFAQQSPKGVLHYRELFYGGEKTVEVDGIQQIGPEIAKSRDIYLCAAKRYYRFFTGVNVELTQPATKNVDKYHQDLVLSLASTLQSKKDVRSLLAELFKSQPFRTRNYMTEQSQ